MTVVEERIYELEKICGLNSEIRNTSSQNLDNTLTRHITTDALLDGLIALYEDYCSSPNRQRDTSIVQFAEWVGPFVSCAKQLRLQRNDFDPVSIIGKGAFGEVSLVRMKDTGRVYAMKTLNKNEMLKRAEVCCFCKYISKKCIFFLDCVLSRRKRCFGSW